MLGQTSRRAKYACELASSSNEAAQIVEATRFLGEPALPALPDSKMVPPTLREAIQT